MNRRSLVQELMSEVVVYGGLITTRGEAYEHAFDATGNWLAADRFACSAPLATPIDIQNRLALAAVLAHEAKQEARKEIQ